MFFWEDFEMVLNTLLNFLACVVGSGQVFYYYYYLRFNFLPLKPLHSTLRK